MADVHLLPTFATNRGSTADLAADVASRICHDLVSPLGAIVNGLELLALSGAPRTPETDLIAQSAQVASARLRFFRLAFGAPSDRPVGPSEIRDILDAMSAHGRVAYEWNVAGPQPRAEVKAALLAIHCLETSLPQGGRIRATRDAGGWTLEATGPRMTMRHEDWSATEDAPVQFRLLLSLLAELGRALSLDVNAAQLGVRF